jgi:hypothetical protein
MKEVAELLNAMRNAGVISEYALIRRDRTDELHRGLGHARRRRPGGLPPPRGLNVPIYDFCATRGYRPEGEAIRVGAWPVRFIPVFSPLTEEALEQAETADFEGTPLRVIRPDHLAMIALGTGRAKDYAPTVGLLDGGA